MPNKNLMNVESHILEMQRLHPSASGDFTSLLGDIAFAAKIIAGRSYANKTDLKSRGILPDSVYNRIAGFITARPK